MGKVHEHQNKAVVLQAIDQLQPIDQSLESYSIETRLKHHYETSMCITRQIYKENMQNKILSAGMHAWPITLTYLPAHNCNNMNTAWNSS